MPLIKREVAPVLVSQIDIAPEIKDELECVSNYTLANIIRQLGNLGRHAEDIFGDLLQEATGMGRRAKDLQTRLEKIKNCVDKLDPLTDAVSLRDINTRMAFKSSLTLDSEVVSSPTMPSAMKDIYLTCAKPPPLSQLNTFRDDGKDGLKMYTDPKFFFERWCNEQSKDIDKKKRRKKKRPQSEANTKRPKKVITRKDKYKNQAMGQEFMDISDKSQANGATDETHTGGDGGKKADHPPPADASPKKLTAKRQAPTLPPAPPPPSAAAGGRNSAGGQDDMPLPPPPELGEDEYSSINYGTMEPPPPPPQPANGQSLPPPPPPPPMGSGSAPGAPPAPPPPPSAGPAPPPPPPVPGIGTVRPPAPTAAVAGNGQPTAATTPARSSNVPQVPISNTQDDLLSAIRQGMQLRKVVVKEKERVSEPEANSVEAILKRRIAVELSSDEETITSSDSEWEEDD